MSVSCKNITKKDCSVHDEKQHGLVDFFSSGKSVLHKGSVDELRSEFLLHLYLLECLNDVALLNVVEVD